MKTYKILAMAIGSSLVLSCQQEQKFPTIEVEYPDNTKIDHIDT